MSRFTPLAIEVEPVGPKSKKVELNSLEPGDIIARYGYEASEGESNRLSYEFSAISCSHSEGKSWQSIFIPLSATSIVGVSITWWNRKVGLSGQINVKRTSIADWYTTVGSKVISKGYEVLAFCGRDNPLARNHEFVKSLHAAGVAIPQAAFSAETSKALSARFGHGSILGEQIATKLSSLPVFNNIFVHMESKNHLHTAMAEFIDTCKRDSATTAEQKDLLVSFASEIIGRYVGAEATGRSYTSAKPTPAAPPKKKEEIYSSWGCFG